MDKKTQSLILNQARRNPHLGVRRLAVLLKKEYALNLSKSTINSVLLRHRRGAPAGCKKAVLHYTASGIKQCFFLLLIAADSYAGVFDYLARMIKPYLPRLKDDTLRKIATLISFAAFSKCGFNSLSLQNFSRTRGLYPVAFGKLKLLVNGVKQKPLALDFAPVRRNLAFASAVKITFTGGGVGFCDASFRTLWDKNCHISHFFMPLHQVSLRLERILHDKLFVIAYTKSFDYLSRVAVDFINNLAGGIKKIEVLSPRDEVLMRCDVGTSGFSFVIGYYPKSLSRGLKFLEKARRFKKIEILGQGMFYLPIITSFSPPKEKRAVILNNLLLRRTHSGMPAWGLLTNKRVNFLTVLKEYVNILPGAEGDFQKDMSIIEKFYVENVTRADPAKFCPAGAAIGDYPGFALPVTILEEILRENAPFSGIKTQKGRVVYSKHMALMRLPGLSRLQKERFNRACFYMSGRRVFIG